MNTVCIMQPTYLPWLGFIDMIDQCHLFVLLDTVPINEKSWQTRNRVLNSQGNETWLSIPVHASQGQILDTVEIAEDGRWRRKHQGTLNALSKSRLELQPLLNLYDREWRYLTEFTQAVLVELCLILQIKTPIVAASVYGLPIVTNPVERVVALLEHVGATEMLNTPGAREFLNRDSLPVGSGMIPVRWHNYEPQPYTQNDDGFTSHMSVVDALARHGARETLRLIRGGRVSTAPAAGIPQPV